MSKRKINFVNGEFYHLYNRGVEKRDIFSSPEDFQRFFECIELLNDLEPIVSFRVVTSEDGKKTEEDKKPLVEFIAYAILPNHYHFLVKQLEDNGITMFMQKFGTAYTKYFNNKYKRTGSLFQGKFKSIHVDTNEYLLYVSAYVNLNDKIKPYISKAYVNTSWGSYVDDNTEDEIELIPCEKSIVLDQFKNRKEYEKFALSVLESVRENKLLQNDLKQDSII